MRTACLLAVLVLAGCTVQDQLRAAKGALDALKRERAAETERDPVRAYFERRNMSEAVADQDEIADWCEEVADRWGDDALDDSPTYDQVCERLQELLSGALAADLAGTSAGVGTGATQRRGRIAGAPSTRGITGATLPPAAAAAEGMHVPPGPGAVSGDLHAGRGVNVADAARRLERELWGEATTWAERWTESAACRDALAEVHYALGAARVRGFKRMLGEIRSGDWREAAYELKRSRWARQVGPRAERIASTLEESCP